MLSLENDLRTVVKEEMFVYAIQPVQCKHCNCYTMHTVSTIHEDAKAVCITCGEMRSIEFKRNTTIPYVKESPYINMYKMWKLYK